MHSSTPLRALLSLALAGAAGAAGAQPLAPQPAPAPQPALAPQSALAPQESAPQESAPQESAPQESAPQESALQERAALTREGVEALARAAAERLAATSPRARLTWRPGALAPSLALHLLAPTEGDTPLARAADFAARHADLWAGVRVTPTEVERRGGRVIVRLEGQVGGLPLLNQDARLSLSDDGRVTRLSSGLEGVAEVRRATRTQEECARLALAHLGLGEGVPHSARRGVVAHAGVATEVVEVTATTAPLAQRLVVLVDAHEGVVLSARDAARR